MATDDLARLFERYRRRGDLAALGAVFDRTAPELLRVAVHLAGDPVEAEDLVQATFLAAIERAATFDAERRLVPWLVGILTNRARAHVRSRARLALASDAPALADDGPRADGLGTVPGGERDPLDDVAAAELEDALARSIDAESAETRAVLVLYLRHRLAPAAIAHALGRPPSTVRTQLARGLERLRARLPRGFVAATAAMPELADSAPLPALGDAATLPALAVPRGLAALRVEVLDAGAAALVAGGVASSSLPIGVLAVKKPLALALAVTLALVGLWLGLVAVRGASLAPAASDALDPVERVALRPLPEPSDRAATAATVGLPVRTDAAVEPATAEPDAPAEPEPTAAPEELALVVRVEEPSGAPVARAEVQVDSLHLPAANASVTTGSPWSVARTAVDGVARLAVPGSISGQEVGGAWLSVRHELYTTVDAHRVDVEAGETTVVLERGAFVVVSGWIGARDAVVTDIAPRVSAQAHLPADAWEPIGDGRPATGRIPPGRHALWLEHEAADGTRWCSAVTELEVARDDWLELHLELVPARELVGRLDARVPRPVSRGFALVNFQLGRGAEPDAPKLTDPRRLRIAPDGTFRVGELPPGRVEVFALCDGWAAVLPPGEEGAQVFLTDGGAWEPQRTPQRFDTEASEIVVVMEPTARLELRVVDPEGVPLEGVELVTWPRVTWLDGDSSSLADDRMWGDRSDADGSALLADLPPGAHTIVLHGKEWMPAEGSPSGLVRSLTTVHLAPDETVERTVHLRRAE